MELVPAGERSTLKRLQRAALGVDPVAPGTQGRGQLFGGLRVVSGQVPALAGFGLEVEEPRAAGLAGATPSFSEEELERLRALGYLP